MTLSKEYRISRPDQIRALTTPARQEIIDALLSSGPASVSEIAAVLGRPADSLYHHIRILQKKGLVVAAEVRRRGRRDEVVYDVPGRPMRIDYDLGNRKVSAGIIGAIGAMLRIAQRDFKEAVAAGTAAVDGPYRDLWAARLKGWIGRPQLKRINGHLQGICKIMLSLKRQPESQLLSLAFVIAPLEPNTRARKRGRSTSRERSPVSTQKPSKETNV
jgi:DNA-binding transcriptional ArsR family regulator